VDRDVAGHSSLTAGSSLPPTASKTCQSIIIIIIIIYGGTERPPPFTQFKPRDVNVHDVVTAKVLEL